jgi:hypothetical protein
MKPTDFAVRLTAFLGQYLPAQKNVSPNTIKAYRDAFMLLLGSIRISQKDKVMFSLVNCLHEVFIDATAALVERAGAAMGTSFTGSHLLNGKG